jgi:hypothetical protein
MAVGPYARAGVRGRAKRLGEARAHGQLRANHGTPDRQRPCAIGRGDVRARGDTGVTEQRACVLRPMHQAGR